MGGFGSTRIAALSHDYDEGSDPTDGNTSKSKVNLFEALFLLNLAKYLVDCGHQPESITILTTYVGQMMLIKQVWPFVLMILDSYNMFVLVYFPFLILRYSKIRSASLPE